MSSDRPVGSAANEVTRCPICLSDVTDRSVTDPCLHEFCYNCIRSVTQTTSRCPLCRQHIHSIIHNIASDEVYDRTAVRRIDDNTNGQHLEGNNDNEEEESEEEAESITGEMEAILEEMEAMSEEMLMREDMEEFHEEMQRIAEEMTDDNDSEDSDSSFD